MTTATTAPILALDSASTRASPASTTATPPPHASRPSRPAAPARLIDRHRPAVVVIEACGPAGWVHNLCSERSVACEVANTASEAWRFKHAKRKTEKEDALRLAQLEAPGQLPAVAVPDKPTREGKTV